MAADEKCGRCQRPLEEVTRRVRFACREWAEEESHALCPGCWERVRSVYLNRYLEFRTTDRKAVETEG